MTSTTEHLRRALAADPARPRVTWYDDLTGERVELSATTLTAWVTKTVNLLTQELEVEEGARVSLHLPRHWVGAVWVLAADAVGASVTCGRTGAAPADVVVADPGSLHELDPGWSELLVVSLAPMGRPLNGRELALVHATQPLARDYLAEVRTMPDHLVPPTPGPGMLGARAEDRAVLLALRPQERVAALDELTARPEPWLDDLLAPLAVDGSALWVRNPEPGRCVRRWEAEHVTALSGELPAATPVPDSIRLLG